MSKVSKALQDLYKEIRDHYPDKPKEYHKQVFDEVKKPFLELVKKTMSEVTE